MFARAIALRRARSANSGAPERRLARALPVAVLLCSGALGTGVLAPDLASAESAWVRGGLRLNLRTEPGTQYRILGVLETGDGIEVLKRNKEWTKVRGPDGTLGWIPKGYLRSDPPPVIRLEQVEAELASLRARASNGDTALKELEARNEELSSRDGDQRSTIEQLSAENSELKKSRRWPEWVTGASVLMAGMLLGGIIHRNSTRRSSARIRL
jgi:uncharacterized protein YgiM (DUF1202 family)